MAQESSGADLQREVATRILSLKKHDETDASFGRRIGLSPQVVSAYRNSKAGASLEIVVQVVRATGVDMQWLTTGKESGTVHPIGPADQWELRALLTAALGIVAPDMLRVEGDATDDDENGRGAA